MEEILKRQLLSKNRKYSPELRAFALTLHFYSPNAYNYVREKFENLLPHPETIRSWYMIINGEPGFTKESFEGIKQKTKEQKVIVNLTCDEMSIRQLIQWDGNKYHGYIDLGTELEGDGDERPAAKNVLVFMAVALNSHWKVPLGYFLIQSLNGIERANLLKTCLKLLDETGAECRSITFDGASVNISMCSSLGASYDYFGNFTPWFLHPNSMEKVYTLWDACHMVKLIRNCFADKRILYDGEGRKIDWKFIEMLCEIQNTEGLHAATKLSSKHVDFHNEKMKVKLAVQTLSASVSSALLFCKTMKISGFEDCDATAQFCLNINNIFDILNSRNLSAKYHYKRGISTKNYVFIADEIYGYINYLSNLKNEAGRSIIVTNRKVGFLGCIIDLKNMLGLYDDLVEKQNLKFILTYKLSQDHLETFFSAVRRRGGHNNNPSALQFKSAYKKLLVRHQISAASTGNCTILDATTILHVGAGSAARTVDTIVDEDVQDSDITDHDYNYFSAAVRLSNYVEDVVGYVSGFVVKKAVKYITCTVCTTFLYSDSDKSLSVLLNKKKWGNLTMASNDVMKICITLEKLIRENKVILFSKKNIKEFLILKLLKHQDFFCSEVMQEHILNQDILDNHKIQLVRLIARFFLECRLHHEAKKVSETLNNSSRIRHKLTKLVLFNNQ